MTAPPVGESAEFNAAVRAYFADPDRIHGDRVTILATGVADDGRAAVIVYREFDSGPTLGLYIDVKRFGRLFDSSADARWLAEIVAVNEIADPSGGAGETMEVPWAAGLVDNATEIRWRLL